MFRIWLSRSSSIPIREQLSAQLLFGILSHRLQGGEKLPSVREFARRIKVHPNTVSAAYQDLVARGWLKGKSGSGVFVRDSKQERGSIEAFVHAWVEEGLARGFSLDDLRKALDGAGKSKERRRVLVVHPEIEFARILAAEIEEAAGCAIECAAMEDALESAEFEDRFFLTTASALDPAARSRPDGHDVIVLKSVEEVIQRIPRPKTPMLMAIVSRSESIRKWASLLTPTLGLVGTDLIQRNPADRDWQKGLAACELVAADVLAVRELPKSVKNPVVLRLTADVFLKKARELVTGEKA